jgi:transposase
MTEYQILTELLDLPQVCVKNYQLVGSNQINVFIASTLEAALCPDCQQVSMAVHDQSEPQKLRDLPMWNRRCGLVYAPRRFKCATCQDTFVERVAWREPGFNYTVRYEQAVYQRTRREPIAQIAQDEGLSEDIIQGIFERWAKKQSSNVATPWSRS